MPRYQSINQLRAFYPPLEGEGRLAWSEAKCETGWGDLSTRVLFERRDLHPTPPRISFAATLPLQGRVNTTVNRSRRHRAIGVNIRGVICVVFAYYGKEAISIISMRPASSNERKAYEESRR